mmetsp:Transcript_116053/g.231346  ORF Transcript_116053/g.231346 Transcript_116053/m.231346 type:complete len:415 (-) Transcript_116053:56-1300(-)
MVEWKKPDWCVAPPPEVPRKVLVLTSRKGEELQVDISTKDHFVVGRHLDELDIKLFSPSASRKHAAVLHDVKGKTFIVDLGSSNGTIMEGIKLNRLAPTEWREGVEVFFSGLEDRDRAVLKKRSPGMAAQVRDRGTKRLREEEVVRAQRMARASNMSLPRAGCAMPPGGITAASSSSSSSCLVGQLPRAKSVQPNGQRPLYGPQASAHPNGQRQASNKCDKCDGPHPTDACPHFKKPREEHKDAWVHYGAKRPLNKGGDGGNYVLRNARAVRQPGDGSCLFHSLCFGLNRLNRAAGRRNGNCAADVLRREIAHFIEQNPNLEISGDTLEEWIRWDANTSCNAYARRMAHTGWGGGIEMAACSRLKSVSVHVYERLRTGEFRRISCFDHPSSKCTVHVLYQGGVHYDALDISTFR